MDIVDNETELIINNKIYSITEEWYWQEDCPSDVSQYGYFNIYVYPNQSSNITVSYNVYGYGWGWYSPGSFNIGWYDDQSKSINLNPETMTEAEKAEYGIEAIPMDQLPARAREFNLDDETLQKYLQSGKPYFYCAHNLPITVTIERPEEYEGPMCVK